MRLLRPLLSAFGCLLFGSFLAGSAPDAKPAGSTVPPDDVRKLVDDGYSAAAESLARVTLRDAESSGDSLRIATAGDLLFESWFAQTKAGTAQAEQLARRSERIKRALLGTADPEYAISLRNLARARSYTSNAAAESLLSETLAIQQRALGRWDLEIAKTLWNLSRNATNAGEHARAATRARQCLAIRDRELPPQHPLVLRARAQLGRAYVMAGDPEGARIQCERILSTMAQRRPPPHPDVAQNLNDLGVALLNGDRLELARAILVCALGQQTVRPGPRSPEAALTMQNLGQVCYRQVEFTRARSLFDSSLAIRIEALGPDHPQIASILCDIGQLELATGAADSARTHLDRAISIYEKAYGSESVAFANMLPRIASMLSDTGDDPDAAEVILRRRLRILEAHPGRDSLALAGGMRSVARVLWMRNESAEARTLCVRALAIQERSLGPEHLDVGYTLHLQGRILTGLREFESAVRCFERCVPIFEKALGKDHPEIPWLWQNWAYLEELRGNYAVSGALRERVLEMRERTMGKNDTRVADALRVVAWNALLTGDAPRALELYQRGLRIVENARGPNALALVVYLHGVGNASRQMGDYATARRYLERALAIREKELGPEDPLLSASLNNLGIATWAQGDLAAATALFERGLRLQERRLGPNHEALVPMLVNLIQLLPPRDARAMAERAVAISEERLGMEHPDRAEARAALGYACAALGERDDALKSALTAEEVGREHFRLTARGLSENEALRFASRRSGGLDLTLYLAAAGLDEAGERATWDVLIASRAMVLDEIAARHRQVSGIGRSARELAAASEHLAQLTVKGPGDASRDRYRQALDEARVRRERAERDLAETSLEFRRERERDRLDLARLAQALAPGSALVSYARYGQRERIVSTIAVDSVPSYLAFVLRGGSREVEVVPLGGAAAIESLVTRWREQASRGAKVPGRFLREADYRVAGERLRQRIWDPVAERLGGVKRAFVVPDAALHLVSLAALPTAGGTYLIESGPLIHYLSTERDLISGIGEGGSGAGLLAIGGPDFGRADAAIPMAGASKSAETAPAPYRGARSSCGDFRSLRWERLPGALRECEEIASLWRDVIAGEHATEAANGVGPHAPLLFAGARATEAAFKANASGRRVLHLATHGFFVEGRCASTNHLTLGDEPEGAAAENPLVLTGLALAGANRRDAAGPDEEDGVLTAEEVAALDLSGVEWAVLSACETGVGEVRAGEGVFGLRRAFQIAGARSLIMSLWSVDDEATREWMRELYDARFGRRMATAEAVREAGLTVLAARRARHESTHPFYWGAFVAAGDWR